MIFIFLVEIDGIGRAEFFAGFAGAFLEVGAVLLVDHRVFWHCLREGGVDRFAVAQPGFVDLIDHFLGAFFLADPAAGAQLFVDIAGFLADGDGEIAHVAIHLVTSLQVNSVMLGWRANGHHLRGQDAG